MRPVEWVQIQKLGHGVRFYATVLGQTIAPLFQKYMVAPQAALAPNLAIEAGPRLAECGVHALPNLEIRVHSHRGMTPRPSLS